MKHSGKFLAVTALALSLFVTEAASAQTPPFPACVTTAQPGQIPAARIYSVGADANVWAMFCGGTAGYTSQVRLDDPSYQVIGTGHQTPNGTIVDLGAFVSGAELVFAIYVTNTGYTYYSGPGSRNPDGIVHAAVRELGNGFWHVGFEDLYGGGDKDYDDINLVIYADVIVAPPCEGQGGDVDDDGICGDVDNCPDDPNTLQEDGDGDGIGDVCDTCFDTDGDGVCDENDNCVDVSNPLQFDSDGDGDGDACDICPFDADNDSDDDGFCGDVDNCPSVANADQEDADEDGLGDACDDCPYDADNDLDADGICGNEDNCPETNNPDQTDLDGDGIGDVCDDCVDIDGDGVCVEADLCPDTVLPDDVPTVRLGVNRFADIDGDGVFDTTSPNGKGPRRAYTLQMTGGCSCAQIIEALDLGDGHSKFGCSISAMDEWIEMQ